MAYRLEMQNDLGTGVRLVAQERLEKGVDVLAGKRDEDPVGAVHQARKEVKKTRSLLRLVRPGLTKRVYRRENRALRNAARTVAHVRDADVMVETVDALHERFAGQLPAHEFAAVRDRLSKDAVLSRERAGEDLGADLVDTLRLTASRVGEWPLDDAGWDVARGGIALAYKRGRQAFAAADAAPTTEHLHDFRKRVKDLWYQERLLKDSWPAVVGAQADEAHALADLLGDEHDLAVLAERLRDDPPTAMTEPLLELIDKRRQELLARIRALGRRVYAEKPKAFARRLDRYLRVAEVTGGVPA